MNKIRSLVLSVCAIVLSVLSANAGTLDALPVWNTPHVLVHVEGAAEAASRLGNSFLLDALLDVHPPRASLLGWLRHFPVESFSLVKGVMYDDEDTFQGAICFTNDREELLSAIPVLSEPMEGENDLEATRRMQEFQMTMHKIFGLPPRKSMLFGNETGVHLFASREKANLYEMHIVFILPEWSAALPVFFASVAQYTDKPTLLIGSTPEDVQKAREAFENETRRLKVERHGSSKNKSFVQINDERGGSLTKDLFNGLPFEPQMGAYMELSLGFPQEEEITLSLRHNLFEVLFGNRKSSQAGDSSSSGNFGLKFGGGKPWFYGALSFLLTEDDVLGAITALSGEENRNQIIEVLKTQFNLEINTFVEAFRTIGVVLGGRTSIMGEDAPGGYIALSGDAEKCRLLEPLLKMLIENLISHSFEAAPRDGWDLFYRLNEEYREQASGLPLCIGLKDGVLLFGSLDEAALEEAPEIEWHKSGENGNSVLRARLDMDTLRPLLLSFFRSRDPMELEEAAENADLEDMLNTRFFSQLLHSLAAGQEIEAVTLDADDWNCLDISIFTREADYEQVWKLTQIGRYLAGEPIGKFDPEGK